MPKKRRVIFEIEFKDPKDYDKIKEYHTHVNADFWKEDTYNGIQFRIDPVGVAGIQWLDVYCDNGKRLVFGDIDVSTNVVEKWE